MQNGKFGKYPPALDKIIAQGKNFQQLEDFNKKKSEVPFLDHFSLRFFARFSHVFAHWLDLVWARHLAADRTPQIRAGKM